MRPRRARERGRGTRPTCAHCGNNSRSRASPAATTTCASTGATRRHSRSAPCPRRPSRVGWGSSRPVASPSGSPYMWNP
jgi:hypothetical protein